MRLFEALSRDQPLRIRSAGYRRMTRNKIPRSRSIRFYEYARDYVQRRLAKSRIDAGPRRDGAAAILRARKYRWLNYDGVRYDNREFKRYRRSGINPSWWKFFGFSKLLETASVFPSQGHSARPFLNLPRRADLIERRLRQARLLRGIANNNLDTRIEVVRIARCRC